MTTKAVNDHHDISVNLEHEAELRILEWRLEVQAIASNLAMIVTPTGLLTHVLIDQEWNDHLANRSTSPNGTVTVAARPNSPRHVPIVAGMTSTAIVVAKYANERHQLWHEKKVSEYRCYGLTTL
jgi:hypothetical protein